MTFTPTSNQGSTIPPTGGFNSTADVSATNTTPSDAGLGSPNSSTSLSSTSTIMQRLNILNIGSTPGAAKN